MKQKLNFATILAIWLLGFFIGVFLYMAYVFVVITIIGMPDHPIHRIVYYGCLGSGIFLAAKLLTPRQPAKSQQANPPEESDEGVNDDSPAEPTHDAT